MQHVCDVASVLLRFQDGETMLLGASERGAMDVVQWLLADIGADPNQANDVRVHALSNQNLHAVMLNDEQHPKNKQKK